MQPAAVRKRRVDERLAEVHPAPGGMEHPLDEVAHHSVRERQRQTLRRAVPRDEDTVRSVDPQLLDRRIVEIGLQGPVPQHAREDLPLASLLVLDDGEAAGGGDVVVPADLLARDPSRLLRR